MTDLKGRTALVTGAGRGIGRAIALALAGADARVVAAARSGDEINGVTEQIRHAGGQAESVRCDITDPASVAALVAAAGPVDILVNNAGLAVGCPLTDLDEELWKQTMNLNLTAPYRLTRMVMPGMIERRWGRVINIASILAKTGLTHTAAYTASKHGLLGFTRAVAAEVVRFGVTVNAVCPGYADTPMTAANVARMAEGMGKNPEVIMDTLARANPQRRLIEPGEVAFVTLMLCSEETRGITGQAVNVDGGAVMY